MMNLANADAERSVLGALMKEPVLLAQYAEQLDGSDFSDEGHRGLYHAMRVAMRQGSVDLVTVGEIMHEAGRLEPAGGPVWIADLLDDCATTAGIEHHVSIVRRWGEQRRIAGLLREVATEAESPQLDEYEQWRDGLSHRLVRVLQQAHSGGLKTVAQLCAEILDDIRSRGDRPSSVVRFGIQAIDSVVAGIHPGELIVIAGRPAMGKSGLVGAIGESISETGRVALFSLEMPDVAFIYRLICARTSVRLNRLRSETLNVHEMRQTIAALGDLSEYGLLVDATPRISMDQIRARCLQDIARSGPLSAVIIDYLQLVQPAQRRADRHVQVGQVARDAKLLAKEVGAPVLLLSQLSRKVEDRDDHRPRMSDLRQSGEIEENADVILLLYRPAYYTGETAPPGSSEAAEIIVAKQRNGRTGTVQVGWRPDQIRYVDL